MRRWVSLRAAAELLTVVAVAGGDLLAVSRLRGRMLSLFYFPSITRCPHLEGMFGSDLELMLESPSWAGAGLGPGSPVALAGEAGVEPELSMEEEDCSTAVYSQMHNIL